MIEAWIQAAKHSGIFRLLHTWIKRISFTFLECHFTDILNDPLFEMLSVEIDDLQRKGIEVKWTILYNLIIHLPNIVAQPLAYLWIIEEAENGIKEPSEAKRNQPLHLPP